MDFIAYAKQYFDKKWHDPVWSQVISAGILTILGAVTFYFSFDYIKLKSNEAIRYCLEQIEVTRWHIVALLVVSSLSVIRVIVNFVKSTISKTPEPWELVTEMRLKGDGPNFPDWIIRWENLGFEQPTNIRFFCDSCKYELEISGGHFCEAVCHCPICGFHTELQVTKSGLIDRAEKMIQRHHRKFAEID